MFHFRQALLRMRQGDSDREIAASKVMGRRKAAALRQAASARGWLGAAQALPEDAEIAQAMSAPRRAASTVSSLQPWRGLIGQWAAATLGDKTADAKIAFLDLNPSQVSVDYPPIRCPGI